MSNVLEVVGFGDLERLQKLSDDLEEILLSIAYDGKAEDLDYIKTNQRHVKRKYGKLIESLADDVDYNPYLAKSKIGAALASIISAYDGLQTMLFLNADIEENARNLLYEYLILPEGSS